MSEDLPLPVDTESAAGFAVSDPLGTKSPETTSPPTLAKQVNTSPRKSRSFLRVAAKLTKWASATVIGLGLGSAILEPAVQTGLVAYDAAASDPNPTWCSTANTMLSTASSAIQNAGDYYDYGRFEDSNLATKGALATVATGRATVTLASDLITIPAGTLVGKFFSTEKRNTSVDRSVYNYPFNCGLNKDF